MENKKIYTTKELCEQLKIDRTTLWRWQNEGRIHFERYGQRLMVPESELKRFGII